MKTLSICMIVKNEEELLARCLNSVKDLVDEIVIVDSGSTDKTLEIAKSFGAKIFYFEWCNDFSKARNFAFSKATSDYILWLDADDVMPKPTLQYLVKNKKKLNADCYMLKYDIAFFDGKPTFSYYRERILKNCKSAIWQGRVHECIAPFGKVEYLNCAIEHRKTKFVQTDRNLKIYKQLKKERELLPREQYYYARELYDHKKYKQAIKEFEKFVSAKQGWKENIIDALYLTSECYFKLNNFDKQILALLSTFKYDTPRANICCKIGDYFLNKNDLPTAKYWYLLATKCEDVTIKGGFVENMFYNYYPYLQLCVCSYKLGNIKDAKNYNDMAEKYYPNSPIVKNNKDFYNKLNIS